MTKKKYSYSTYLIPEFEVLIELLQEKEIKSRDGLMAWMKKLARETKER